MEKLIGSMMLPNGDPTPKLIEEIKREMSEMEASTGSTAGMPQELKDLVNSPPSTSLAQAQALVILASAVDLSPTR